MAERLRTSERTVDGAGVSLAVITAGDPGRPTIVFVHGYPDTKEIWLPAMERLADAFHVVAYDVRGAGRSSAPRGPAAYTLDRLGDDFVAVCDAVAGGRPVHVVGHDWGGIQGWSFATGDRFAGNLASFSSIAGPALEHATDALRSPLRSGDIPGWLNRLRRSWYILPMCTPLGPTLTWRGVLANGRWRRLVSLAEGLPVDDDYPAPTVVADGLHGANLYRANIPRRMLAPNRLTPPHCPVQVIVPSGDRFISDSYYDAAERLSPRLWRRTVAGSHWAPRRAPDAIARWVREFVEAVEDDGMAVRSKRGWKRGGGTAQLAGALAVVTGAGSGIGRATAHALAGRGARVLMVDLNEAAVTAAADEVPDAVSFVCDVADEDAMARLASEVVEAHGAPDVLINNAGIGIAGSFLDMSAEDWRSIVGVNLMGVVNGCRLFAPAMIARGTGGQIVNTASAAAFAPNRSLGAYSTTKAAVLMFSESLRAEMLDHGIGVSAICPGLIATNITRTTRYLGDVDAQAMAERVTRLYERRNFTADQVAERIVAAIAGDHPMEVVTPEAKLMRALSRLSPGLVRRLARVNAPGV